MSHVTYFPRYTSNENAATNSTLHLFSQINQHSVERLSELLTALFDDEELPLGITFEQQKRKGSSVPDGAIQQEPIHIVIETKVDASVDVSQLIRHCGTFTAGRTGNYLMLLTRDTVAPEQIIEVRKQAKAFGATFKHITFEGLCEGLEDCAEDHEIHLKRVVEDYREYCSEMGFLPDRRKWLRIVPCGDTVDLNAKWHVYYQPTSRGYRLHEYLGIYYRKAVRYVGKIAAIYDNSDDGSGAMALTLAEGLENSLFRERIKNMIADTRASVGWDISRGHRFFCVNRFIETDFPKISKGGIQGPRFWDASALIQDDTSDDALAGALRLESWK